MDLIGDKVFVAAMFFVIASYRIIPLWLPTLVFIREVVITFIRWRGRAGPIEPDGWGKAKTAASFAAIVLLSLQQGLSANAAITGSGASVLHRTALSTSLAAAALTVTSAVRYVARGGLPVPKTARDQGAWTPAREEGERQTGTLALEGSTARSRRARASGTTDLTGGGGGSGEAAAP
jgi:phosphatidylglycerophosphate synthase